MKNALVTALLVLLLPVSPNSALAADYSKDPVLMVHGYFLGDFLTWASIKGKLIDDGWPEEYLYEAGFADVFGCNPEHGMEIAAKVQQILTETGRQKVDLLAHSMGAIDCRFYIKFLCGYQYVRDVVMLAGANKGTIVACIEPISCGADSMCVGNDEGDWQENPFLASLNACDMTPGEDIKYTSVWSSWDEIIMPQENSIIDGARNYKMEAWGVGHAGILLKDESYQWVKVGLDGGGLNDNVPTGVGPCLTICDDPIGPEPTDPDPVVEPMEDIVQEETMDTSDLIEQDDLPADLGPSDQVVQPDSDPADAASTDLISDLVSDQSAPGDSLLGDSISLPDLSDTAANDFSADHLDKDGIQMSDLEPSADATLLDASLTDSSTGSDATPSSNSSGGCSASGQSPSVPVAPLLLAFVLATLFLLRHLRNAQRDS